MRASEVDVATVAELGGPERALSIEELGRVLGGLRHVELEAFAVLGRLAVAADTPPGVASWAASESLAHAWRAGELERLLPVSDGLASADECTRSPGPRAGELLALLAGDGAGAAPVLDGALTAAYERRIAFAHPSADAPVVRTLRRVLADMGSSERVEGAS